MTFYKLNADIFTDPEEQHRKEVEAQLAAVEASWLESLTPDDRALIEVMEPEMREAFRICRDLASQNEGRFFLSCNNLGDRLGITPPKAFRILERLQGLEIIVLEKKGKRREPGVLGKGRASEWQYLHQLPTPTAGGISKAEGTK